MFNFSGLKFVQEPKKYWKMISGKMGIVKMGIFKLMIFKKIFNYSFRPLFEEYL